MTAPKVTRTETYPPVDLRSLTVADIEAREIERAEVVNRKLAARGVAPLRCPVLGCDEPTNALHLPCKRRHHKRRRAVLEARVAAIADYFEHGSTRAVDPSM